MKQEDKRDEGINNWTASFTALSFFPHVDSKEDLEKIFVAERPKEQLCDFDHII